MLKNKYHFFYIMLILCFGYAVSQFLRTSVGVLSPNLMNDFDISPDNMGLLGGVFFLSFALFQIPAGILIDRYGPHNVMTSVIVLAVLGSVIFALSNSFIDLLVGRVLMGLGCSICLMGSLVLITRWAERDQFSKLAGIILAIGGLGGLLATTPLSAFSELYGWKLSFWIASIITFLVMILYYVILRDTREGIAINRNKEPIYLKNIFVVFKERNFKYMIPMSLMSYSSIAVIIGLWGAPYLKDVHGLEVVERGKILMIMAICWNLGSYIFGRLSSIFGNYKRVVIFGSLGVIILLIILSFISNILSIYLYILFCALGFFGAFSVALLSHYQVLFDKEYMGRALSTANFFNFGGVFLIQWITGKIIFFMGGNSSGAPLEAYRIAFLFVAILLSISLCIYMLSNEDKKHF